MQEIEIVGANKHNLKNINVKIPKKKLVTITGVSGSGKSTLAYDTIFQEGQRKYLESLSMYARQFIKSLEKPDVQHIKGISPTISIDQKHSSFFHNSSVGTISEVSQYLRLLYAKVAEAYCPGCGRKIKTYSHQKILDYIYNHFINKLVFILAPVVKNRKGTYKVLFEKYIKRGYLKCQVDGKMVYLDSVPELNRNVVHNIAIQIDAIEIKKENQNQLTDSLALAVSEGNGELILLSDNKEYFFSDRLFCSNCNISLREPQPATFSFSSPLGSCSFCLGKGADPEGETCSHCLGSGLNNEARSFYFRGKNIFECGEMEIRYLLSFLKDIKLNENEVKILSQIYPHIIQRLESFIKLNLEYMTLNRKINTLSGGELQRTRLVSQIGFGLSGIIYILDEPSIGMHMTEQNNLIYILNQLKKKDNTIIVVEHDENTIKSSDYVIDLGPGAGENGGKLIFSGWIRDFKKVPGSLTADYLFKRKEIDLEKKYSPNSSHYISLQGVSIHNIKNANLKIPLKSLTVVTGVSGSGKSSLIINALYHIVKAKLDEKDVPLKSIQYKNVAGVENLDRILMVDQTSIGKNSRSCPATYVNIMPIIRELFAGLPESKIRGYDQSRFSFNVKGGRCEACSGLGSKKLEMSFLPNLEIICPVCQGKRYNLETLQIKYKGLSISDVLELTATEAYAFFRNIPYLSKKIKILNDVGLGYLKLGQSSVTLSGGESQRIKLSKELSRISAKSTVYVLDEPTIGLHFDDIQKLINVFNHLIVKGNTIVVIEHNMEIIKIADYIVDLGPGGGNQGGKIVYQGVLKGILKNTKSKTAYYLQGKMKDAV